MYIHTYIHIKAKHRLLNKIKETYLLKFCNPNEMKAIKHEHFESYYT